MSNYDNYSVSRSQTAAMDAGLRSYMLGIYNYMAAGVAVTGVTAYFLAQYFIGNPDAYDAVFRSGMAWVVLLAPLAFVMVLSFGINRLSAGAMRAIFFTFAAVMGVSLSTIFLVYTGASIARIFFITMIMFSALSVWGYTTKKDLSGMGTFMFMGLIGLIIASVVNLFLQSSALEFGISVVGVLVFAGLTAWDNQRLKENYYVYSHDSELLAKGSVMGALTLYLDFINMFLFLLRLFGSRD